MQRMGSEKPDGHYIVKGGRNMVKKGCFFVTKIEQFFKVDRILK